MKKVLLLLLLIFILIGCGNATDTTIVPMEVGNAGNGEVLFNQTCQSCHGVGGIGVPNLGKDMTQSEFIAGLDDVELLTFIKTGRDVTDPLNTTGVAMPAKGGNPILTDAQINDIIAYIRTIQQ